MTDNCEKGEVIAGNFDGFDRIDDTEAAISYLVDNDDPNNKLTQENRQRALERIETLGIVPPLGLVEVGNDELTVTKIIKIDFKDKRRVL